MKRNLFKKGILVTALMFVCINTSLAENKTEDSKSLSFNIVKQVKDILNVSENPDASSSATTTSTSTYAVLATSTPYFCEAQNKINIKKEMSVEERHHIHHSLIMKACIEIRYSENSAPHALKPKINKLKKSGLEGVMF